MYKAIRALPPSPKSQVLGLLGKGPLPVAAAVLFLLDRRIKSLMRVATKKEQFRWGWQRREMSPGGEYLGQGMFERTAHAASS